MVKAYLRYELDSTFGLVTSSPSVVYDRSGKHVITAALENIAIWNIRQGTQVKCDLSDAAGSTVSYCQSRCIL